MPFIPEQSKVWISQEAAIEWLNEQDKPAKQRRSLATIIAASIDKYNKSQKNEQH